MKKILKIVNSVSVEEIELWGRKVIEVGIDNDSYYIYLDGKTFTGGSTIEDSEEIALKLFNQNMVNIDVSHLISEFNS